MEYEEILKSRQFKTKKYLAFQPSMSKNGINDIKFYENKQA
jgi:hypothetical protein